MAYSISGAVYWLILNQETNPMGPNSTVVATAVPTRRPAFWPYSRSMIRSYGIVIVWQIPVLSLSSWVRRARWRPARIRN